MFDLVTDAIFGNAHKTNSVTGDLFQGGYNGMVSGSLGFGGALGGALGGVAGAASQHLFGGVPAEAPISVPLAPTMAGGDFDEREVAEALYGGMY